MIKMAVGVLYEAIPSGDQHPLDIMQVLLYVLLCEEHECVPTEHEVTTITWYRGTICLVCAVEFEILLVCRRKFLTNVLFNVAFKSSDQQVNKVVQSPGSEVH